MDPLSDVLSLLKPRSYGSAGFDVGGTFSIQYPQHPGIKCYAIVHGEAWLTVEGVADPVHLSAGDCFLLPRGRPFRLYNDAALTPTDAFAVYSQAKHGAIVTWNGGGDFFLTGAHFHLSGDQAQILLGILPPIVHIRDESDQAALRWAMERMRQELREGRPGGALVAEHLAHLMLVQALRLALAEGAAGGVGWLYALADKQMAAAIGAMHAEPAHPWTLATLAERAGMSRSTFALKFKATVGASPMDYLTRWRMVLAGERLAQSSEPIAAIALSLGYESESAFSTAFKRVMGASPRQHGRRAALQPQQIAAD